LEPSRDSIRVLRSHCGQNAKHDQIERALEYSKLFLCFH
jgi:hypothetical protein